jgi:hypothetical protein
MPESVKLSFSKITNWLSPSKLFSLKCSLVKGFAGFTVSDGRFTMGPSKEPYTYALNFTLSGKS